MGWFLTLRRFIYYLPSPAGCRCHAYRKTARRRPRPSRDARFDGNFARFHALNSQNLACGAPSWPPAAALSFIIGAPSGKDRAITVDSMHRRPEGKGTAAGQGARSGNGRHGSGTSSDIRIDTDREHTKAIAFLMIERVKP